MAEVGTREAVLKWTENKKRELIANYNYLGLKNSGNWEKELETQVTFKSSLINIKFLGASYTKQLTEGRGPNLAQSQERLQAFVGWAGSTWLKDWVERTGSSVNPYAIAWKIGREGIEVPSTHNPGTLVSDVLNRREVDKLVNEIGGEIIGQLKTDLKRS